MQFYAMVALNKHIIEIMMLIIITFNYQYINMVLDMILKSSKVNLYDMMITVYDIH
jgi:hypothetical protein